MSIINAIVPHTTVNATVLIPDIVSSYLLQEHPLRQNDLIAIDGILIRLRLSGLESFTSEQFPVSLERQPLIEEFYQSILHTFQQTPAYLVDFTTEQITFLFYSTPNSTTTQIALQSVERALSAAKRWAISNQSILKSEIHLKAVVLAASLQMAMLKHNSDWQAFLYEYNTSKFVVEAFSNANPWEVLVQGDLIKKLDLIPSGGWRTPNFFVAKESFIPADKPEGDNPLLAQLETQHSRKQNISDQQLQTFINQYLWQYLVQHKARTAENLQDVTCVHVQFPHQSLTHEGSLQHWTDHLHHIHELAKRYGGYVDFTQIDATQARLSVYFGILDVEGDQARQAVGFAFALNQRTTYQIGIASRQGVFALPGDLSQRSFFVITGARLQAKALSNLASAGSTIVDPTTFLQIEEFFEWETVSGQKTVVAEKSAISAVQLRKKHKLKPLFAVDNLEERLNDLVKNRSSEQGKSVILIKGKTGSGRSAIIDQLSHLWVKDGGTSYLAVGSHQNPQTPYYAWFRIWRTLFGISIYDDTTINQEHLKHWFKLHLPEHPHAALVIQDLLGLSSEPIAELQQLNFEARQNITSDAMVAILEQQAPVLLIFENVQNIDSLSLKLIQTLATRLQGKAIRFCIEVDEDQVEQWQKLNPEVIETRNWSSTESQNYLKQHLSEMLERKALSLLKKDMGSADVHSLCTVLQQFDITPKSKHELHSLILEQLSEDERLRLAQVAIWGMVFPIRAPWLNTYSTPRQKTLDKLVSLGIVELFWEASELMVLYRFRRSIFRNRLFSMLPPEQHERITTEHRQFVQSALPGSTHYAGFLQYLNDANDLTHYEILAGNHARDWGALDESNEHYKNAEDLIQKKLSGEAGVLRRIQLLTERARYYLQQNAQALGVADIELAMELANSEMRYDDLTQAMLVRIHFHQQKSENTAAIELADRIINIAREHRLNQAEQAAIYLKAKSLRTAKRMLESTRFFNTTISQFSDDSPPIPHAQALLDATQAHLFLYQRDKAHTLIKTAYDLRQRIGDPSIVQHIYALDGQVNLLFGESSHAADSFEKALQFTSPKGQLASTLKHHAVAQCYLGKYTTAQTLFTQAKAHYQALGNTSAVIELDVLQAGEWMADQGDYTATLQHFDTILAQDHITEEIKAYTYLIRAGLYTRAGQYGETQKILGNFREEIHGHLARWYRPVWHLRMGELALYTQRYDDALRQAYKALGLVGPQSEIRYLTLIYGLIGTGLYQTKRKPSDAAIDALQRAIRTARKQAKRIYLAQALQLMGSYIRTTSERQAALARSSGFRFEATMMFDELAIKPSHMWDIELATVV